MSTATVTPAPAKVSWYFTVAAVLFLFVLVGLYSARIAHETTGYDDEQAQIRLATLHKMQDTDRKTLTTADWIDQDKGIVRIPIFEAMTEEVPVLAAKPLAMGTAIPGATAMNTVPAKNAPSAATGAPPAANGSTNAVPTGSAPPTTSQPTK
jgi:hypothetical protein